MSAINRRPLFALTAFLSVSALVAVPASISASATSETSAQSVVSGVPRDIADKYRLDTNFYGKYIDAWGVPVLGSRSVDDATLIRAKNEMGTLLWTYPSWPVPSLNRHNIRVVITARGERMSNIPEVNAIFGTSLDDRYWGGMGATDSLPISVGTEANLMDNLNGENAFVHEFGHTLMEMALQYDDATFMPELRSAWNAALAAGRWRNTYAGSAMREYWAEGVQSYFDVNHTGPVGGDGVHNEVSTRARLTTYDAPLFALLDRVFHGASLRS